MPVRRRLLMALLAGGCLPAVRAQPAAPPPRLLAAWQHGHEQHVGLVTLQAGTWSVARRRRVPTRAHGLFCELDGSVLAVARRPGDWLLRWHPESGRTQWHWVENDRRFNGHAIADGRALWSTETELEGSQGLVALRDAHTLRKLAEWPTHGHDPHQLLALPEAVGPFTAGVLMVANGGIRSAPETGRAKHGIDHMDASLAALHPRTGALLGVWRLADTHLSIRHLAWDPVSKQLGIALQAEHPAQGQRQAASVLAVWNGQSLRTAHGQPALAGYGGDIVALPGGGFAVSCPKAQGIARFDAHAAYRDTIPLAGACALARTGGRYWSAGASQILELPDRGVRVAAVPEASQGHVWDNHWVALGG